MKFKIPK